MNDYLKTETKKNSNIKLALYIAIAVLTSALTQLNEITDDTLTWNEWGIFGISIFLPGLVVWRAFVDRTTSRVEHTDEANKLKNKK